MNPAAWLEQLWQDVRHGLRVFAKAPGFTAIAVLSIACGTGANVAIFSVADALLLRPLPVPRPGELLVVGSRIPSALDTFDIRASYPDYVDIRTQSRTFDGVMAHTLRRLGVSVTAAAPPQVRLVRLVSANFFEVLQVTPVLGRGFVAEDERVPGRDAVAVLSYGAWINQYAADQNAIGRTIHISGIDFTIVGVAPESFTGLETRQIADSVFIPLAMAPALGDASIANLLTARDLRILSVKGRLAPGGDLGDARAELAVTSERLERTYPVTNERQALVVQTELETRLQDTIDSGLVYLLSFLSTLVLVVACANVAGLLGSRTPVRLQEIALRLAMGADRARLVRQLITESLMLAMAGAVCGLGVGYAGILVIRQAELPSDMIAPPLVGIDERTLLFNLAIAMFSAFAFGIGPALRITRLNVAARMKAADSSGRRRLWARGPLVALQIALALVLVSVSVFTWQVFRRVYADRPGFRVTQVAKVSVDTAVKKYDPRDTAAFFERALEAARRLPGVTSASAVSSMPLWGYESALVVPEDMQMADGERGVTVVSASIDEDYFQTLEIAITRGRRFLPTDSATAAPVAIVNETFVRRYWPDRDPIGRRVRLGGEDGPALEVVGVAADSKYLFVIEQPQEAIYFPFRQQPRGIMVLLAATGGPSEASVGPLRGVINDLDPALPVFDAQSIEALYEARATGLLRFTTQLIGGLGVIGVLLAMVGLYGLVSYSVARRTREIGIRMAIGATYARVLALILRQGMTPAWIGLPLGLLASVLTMRLLPAIIPTDRRYDPVTFVLIVPLLLAVALLAAYVPARSAARVDPTVALRHD